MADPLELLNTVHRDPVWRDKANWIVVAELPEEGRGEQLWSRKTGERTHELCCIPFFLYDIALGDTFEVDGDGRFLRRTERAGHRVWRISFESGQDPGHAVADRLASLGALLEWSSGSLLAVDATRDLAPAIDVYLVEQHGVGALVMERAAPIAHSG